MSDRQGSGQIVASGIVAPNRRDFGALEATLHDWLRTRLDGASHLRTSNFAYPRGAGLSHETILFDADWTHSGERHRQDMVIRIKPTDHTVYHTDQFVQQYEIMAALHRAGRVPIAEPLWLERDAGIQSLPPDQAGFLDPEGRYADGFEQEWDRWCAYFDWARAGRDFPLLDDIWCRLERDRPTRHPPGLVWGDVRIGNMTVADDLRVVAVMDWEAPGIGGALHDLGYWTVMSRIETEQQGIERLDGMDWRDETIALWHEVTGIETDGIEWYEMFALWKLSCLAIRTLALFGGERPGMNRFDNPATRVLADMCGLPPPTPGNGDLQRTGTTHR